MNKKIPNYLMDKNMSLKAKGLLSQMILLKNEFNFSIEKCSEINRDGIDSIRSAIKELETYGYLDRNLKRNKNGRISQYEYNVYPNPKNNPKYKKLEVKK